MIHTYQDRSTLLSGFVSLLGRISLLKGISILAFPQLKTSVTKLYTKSFLIVAGIVSILI
ncbi:MAG: hypothetical protein Q8O99_05715 [bacterium]|nr:hypothetical protein [bacterium]